MEMVVHAFCDVGGPTRSLKVWTVIPSRLNKVDKNVKFDFDYLNSDMKLTIMSLHKLTSCHGICAPIMCAP